MALRLFLEEGSGALTPTRLHKETGIARATIYRNWPEPCDLIELMLARATEGPPADLFVGEVEADLRAATELLLFRFEHRPVRAFFAACLDHGRRSPRVGAVAESFVAGILQPFRTVIEGGLDDGTLVGGSVDELVAELAGPLFLDHLVLGRDVPAARAEALVDAFLDRHRLGR